METVFIYLRLLIVAAWLGAALLFAVSIAPTAFAVLPTRELTGQITARVLAMLNISGTLLGAAALVSILIFTARRYRTRFFWIETVSLFLLTAACAVGQWVFAAQTADLRAQIGRPIDELAADDALRLSVEAWNEWSILMLIVAMASALLAVTLEARRKATAQQRNSYF